MKETGIILVILSAFLGVCALAELLGDWMTEYAPDWIWIPLFLSIPAGLVVYLWKWYRQAVERETTEREEGDDPAHL